MKKIFSLLSLLLFSCNLAVAAPLTSGKLIKSSGGANVADSIISETGTTATVAGTLVATTFSGSAASLTAIPAAQVSGVIPIANLATGTPDGTKFIRDDGTLQAGGGGATTLGGLTDINSSTATAGNLLVADGSKFGSAALSGDCTIQPSGLISCSATGSPTWNSITPPTGNASIAFGNNNTAWTTTLVGGDFLTITPNANMTDGDATLNFIEGSGNPVGGAFIEFNNADNQLADIKGNGYIKIEPNATGSTNTQIVLKAGATGLCIGSGCDNNTFTGSSNTLVGQSSGATLTSTATRNVFIGDGILGDSTTTSVIIGNGAGASCTTCTQDILIGVGAGSGLTTAQKNTFISTDGGNNLTTSTQNIIMGYHVDFIATALDNSVHIGNQIYADNPTPPTNSVAIGYNQTAGNGFTNTIAIGYQAIVGASNTAVIGDSNVNTVLGATVATASARLTVSGETNLSGVSGDGNGKVVCVKSDTNLGTCTDVVGVSGTCTCN